MYENGEEILTRTVIFSQNDSGQKVFVTIKDHYTWEEVSSRAWAKMSELLDIPVIELQNDYSIEDKVHL